MRVTRRKRARRAGEASPHPLRSRSDRSSRAQSDRDQSCETGAERNTTRKPRVAVAEVGKIPAAVGTARAVPIEEPRAAAHDSQYLVIRIERLACRVVRIVGIGKIGLAPILAPQTACPFPHVAAHFLAAVRAERRRIAADRAGLADRRFRVGFVRVEYIRPRDRGAPGRNSVSGTQESRSSRSPKLDRR